MSTIPAIVQVIFGFLVGDFIRKRGQHLAEMEKPAVKGFELYQMLTVLFIAAVALLFTGYAWGLVFPINKKIWTSSYVVYTSGLAIIILATLIYAVEIKQMRGWWTKFFNVFGKNALFIFAFSSFLPKTLWMIRWQTGVNDKGIDKLIPIPGVGLRICVQNFPAAPKTAHCYFPSASFFCSGQFVTGWIRRKSM